MMKIESPESNITYSRVLDRTLSPGSREKVQLIFELHANMDGDDLLSPLEARQAEGLLNKYDHANNFDTSYSDKEVTSALLETETVYEVCSLFRKAYVYKKDAKGFAIDKSPEHQRRLRELLNRGVSYSHPKIIEIARKSSPDLSDEDRVLIYNFENARCEEVCENAEQDRKFHLKKMEEHMCKLVDDEVNGYEGTMSSYDTIGARRIRAFRYALEFAVVNSGDNYDAHKLENHCYFKSLSQSAEEILENTSLGDESVRETLIEIFSWKGDPFQWLRLNVMTHYLLFFKKEELYDILRDAYVEWTNSPCETNKKAYLALELLYSGLVTVFGFTRCEIQSAVYRGYLKGLDNIEEEIDKNLCPVDIAEETPEKSDDHIEGKRILDRLPKLCRDYTRIRKDYLLDPSEESGNRFFSEQNLLSGYIDSAFELGVSYSDINRILREEGIFSRPPSKPSLNSTAMGGKAALISPMDLPREVRSVLMSIGILDDIMRDVSSITYIGGYHMTNPPEHSSYASFSGMAFPTLKNIILVLRNIEHLPPHNIYEMVSVVIHEWLYITWESRYRRDEMKLKSVPSQRHSYLGTAKLLKPYLKKLVSRSRYEIQKYHKRATPDDVQSEDPPEGNIIDIWNLAWGICHYQLRGVSYNELLGLSPDNLNPGVPVSPRYKEKDLNCSPGFPGPNDELFFSTMEQILNEAGYPYSSDLIKRRNH